MTFTIRLASDWEYIATKTFNSLEELEAFSLEEGHKLVIDFVRKVVTVYDDYIEQSPPTEKNLKTFNLGVDNPQPL